MTYVRRVAWTGGSPPRGIKDISAEEKLLIAEMYHEQIKHWVSFWGDQPPREVLRIFWGRARHDAHATCRR